MKNKALLFSLIAVSFSLGFAAKTFLANKPQPVSSKKVTGIGGVFFKSKEPNKLRAWYQEHLGLQTNPYGAVFEWYQGADSTKKGFTQWSPFKETTKYFEPSAKDFMINYRVENLESLVADLRKAGVQITDTIEKYDYGKFVHIMDPEGNKIELWEPDDVAYEKMGKDLGSTTTR